MITLLLSALLLGLDSLIAAGALSPLIETRPQRWRLATVFGVCDGLAVLFGSVLNWSGNSVSRAAPFLILGFGIYCLVAAQWNRFRANPRLAYVLPVLMSFDNLTYGVGSGPLTSSVVVHATVLALTSFIMARLGLSIVDPARFQNLRIAERVSGFALVSACFALLLM